MASYTNKPGASRQKAFSHKVRSGCITCKRRRVKCDERKPACLNCTRGDRVCLGYATPRPRIFTFANPRDSSSEQCSEQTSPSQTSDSATSEDSIVFRLPNSAFGTEEENSHLQHFLSITAPMLAQYGPEGEFYTVVVPQFALQSHAVKHMLLALSMTHKKFHIGVTSVSKSTASQAVSHYISAIADIVNNNPSKMQVAVASLVGWTLELMQNNIPAALTHLMATSRLVEENKELGLSDSAEDILLNSIQPTASLAKGLTALMLQTGLKEGDIEPEYSDHLYAPWIGPPFSSIVEARDAICGHLEVLAVAKTENEIQQGEKRLSYWFETVRRWDQESIRSPDLSAMMLLFNIGLALFPSSDVSGYSYSDNPDTIKFVVDSATDLALRKLKIAQNSAELQETLRIVLEFVVRLFPGDPNRSRAMMLLQRLGK